MIMKTTNINKNRSMINNNNNNKSTITQKHIKDILDS